MARTTRRREHLLPKLLVSCLLILLAADAWRRHNRWRRLRDSVDFQPPAHLLLSVRHDDTGSDSDSHIDYNHDSGSDSHKTSKEPRLPAPLLATSERYRNEILRAVQLSSINTRCTGDKIDPRYDHLTQPATASSSPQSPPAYFFALNLHNAQLVVPDMTLQLLRVFQHLGTDNVYVAVFENGSNDRTKSDLALLDILLSTMGVRHDIIVDGAPRNDDVHRIEYLAGIRNRVLDLMLQHAQQDPALTARLRRIVFLNDIFICADEILELVHQSVFHAADMACALDYDRAGDEMGFYDTWVARDVQGNYFGKLPWNGFVQDADSRDRLGRNLTFQAFCCWNGATVLNPAAFLPPHNIRFRRQVSERIPTAEGGETLYRTCSGSEISLLCLDLAKHGFHRRIIVPTVKVAYTWDDYTRLRPALASLSAPKVDSELVFRPEPERSLCFPLDGLGKHPSGVVGWEVLELS